MVRTEHLGRYKDLAFLLTRYGLKDFRLDLDAVAEPVPAEDDRPLEPDVQERAKAFSSRLREMGPTFVKFGQLLSTRPDIVPPEYVIELEALQDSVEPFSFAEVEKIIEEELQVRISKAFEELEAVPIAAASLGQVHRAVLRDGREVVVKVQRPNVREVIRKDLEVFTDIASALESHTAIGRKMNLLETVEDLRRTLLNELDYLQEARNAAILRKNLAGFEELYIPEVIADLTTSKVLTTELVRGKKVSRITNLSLIENDYARLAAVITRAYLKQICVDGFWHSDPHPGNVFLRDDQIVLLDFGMVSRIGSEGQDNIIKMLLGITENRGREVAEVCRRMGREQEGFDEERFYRDISAMVTTYHDADMSRTNVGQLIFQVIAIASNNELRIPSEMAMLGKTLLNLDGITSRLDPDFNPQQVIQEYSQELIAQKVRQRLAPRNYYSALLDLNQLALDLPSRSREIVDKLAGGRMEFRVHIDETNHILKGMQRIANRITVGLVIAALLVASALIMQVPTDDRWAGYPVLAIGGYLIAAAMGIYLVVSIFRKDRRDREVRPK